MVNVKTVAPPELGAAKGYSHGMRVGDLLFTAGQIGGEPDGEGGHKLVDGFVAQFEKALENVVALARQEGGTAANVVEMTVFVTDMQAYRTARGELAGSWRRIMGRHYPAITLVAVSELFEPGALVEVRAVVALPAGAAHPDETGEVN